MFWVSQNLFYNLEFKMGPDSLTEGRIRSFFNGQFSNFAKGNSIKKLGESKLYCLIVDCALVNGQKKKWPFNRGMALSFSPQIFDLEKKHMNLGNIHVLRKQKGGREGVSQMLTIAYLGGGGAKGSCLRNHFDFFLH